MAPRSRTAAAALLAGGGTVVVVVLLLAATAVPEAMSQATYDVGGSCGWASGCNNNKWVSEVVGDNCFHIGDSLVFKNFSSPDTVSAVHEEGFNSCETEGQVIDGWEIHSPQTVQLAYTGTYHFITADKEHCIDGGMKMTLCAS